MSAGVVDGGRAWEARRVSLCNTDRSIAVADAATAEVTHIVNAVGRPASMPGHSELCERLFHCDAILTEDDLAAEVLRNAPGRPGRPRPQHRTALWLDAALDGAGTFMNDGHIPGFGAVPNFLHD